MLAHTKQKKFFVSIFSIALLFLVGLFMYAFFPVTSHAAVPWDFGEPILQCGGEGEPTCQPCDIFQTIKNIIEILFTIAGSVAILNIVIAGTVYIVAPMAGNASKRVGLAKSIITYTIAGFIIIGLSWAILNTVVTLLGFSKDWFTVDCQKINALLEEPAPIITPAQTYYCGASDQCVAAPATLPAGTATYTSANCGGVCVGIIQGDICKDENPDAMITRLKNGGTVCNNRGSCGGLCNSSEYDSDISAASQKYGIDSHLIKVVIHVESTCRKDAVRINRDKQGNEKSRDCGLMQVNTTSHEYCEQLKTDVSVAIDAGTKFLQSSYNNAQSKSAIYGSSVTTEEILGANYNGGPGINEKSEDCQPATGWPSYIPQWACPINPGDAETNACDVRRYACNFAACVKSN